MAVNSCRTLWVVATVSITQARGGLLSAARSRAGDAARRRRLTVRLAHGWRWVRPLLGSTAGLACFVAAAFLASLIAGLVVTGLALLVLDWYSTTPACEQRRLRR